jgi:putative membrane protein
VDRRRDISADGVVAVRIVAHVIVTTATSPWDILAIALLGGAGTLYAAGQWRLSHRGGAVRRAERIAFWSGWIVMLAAVLPPLDGLATQRFAAHMLQHELLMLVGVPLLIAGRPIATWLWGLPDALRPRAARLLQGRPISGLWRSLTTPVLAWALHGLTVWIWHVPRLYELAVHNEAVHAFQHAMFVGTSVFFWWGLVYGRYGRAGYGASVFYVFTTIIHTGLLGAVFTLIDIPLYGVYAERAPDPVADQQLAGLVMWVPAGLVLTIAGIGLFAAWLGEAERRSRHLVPMLFAAALGAFGSVGCGNNYERVAREMTGGEPTRGPQAIRKYGCDTCHTIPGVLTADATVGPPLTQIAQRAYLAGRIDNTPENMIRWIRHPHSVDEKTLMPEMGVSVQDGRDIAAYLYTLR